MTDFSFQNRAYDLLLNLAEDKLNVPKITINSIKDLRLMIDIVKDVYPVYANVDNKSIVDFVKDIFNIGSTQTQVDIANRELDEIYRPVECWEIKPGVELKIIEESGTWYHTFWTYCDTNEIIPLDKTTPRDYSQAYMYIWRKAEKGKVFIKNTYKYRIGDTVRHKDDLGSLGTIKSRIPAGKPLPKTRPYEFMPNNYGIYWSNTGNNPEVPLKYWYNEDELIVINKLEASPMKTKNRKKHQKIQYKVYNPKEWLKQKIAEGYDKAVYLTLLQQNRTNGIDPSTEHGWITKERVQSIKQSAVREKNRLRRRRKHARNLATYTVRKSNVLYKEKDPLTNNTSLTPHPLVCVKFTISGEIARIRKNEAEKLVTRNNGNYIYVSKQEWRKYLKDNEYPFINPKLSKPMGKDIMGHEYAIGNRKIRRHIGEKKYKGKPTKKWNKYVKFSEEDRLERSKLDQYAYLQEKGKKSLDDLKEEFKSDERRYDKFSPVEEWSRSITQLYKTITTSVAEVAKGIFKQLPKKGIKVVINDILKYQSKLDWSEEKITDFIRYLRLTTHGIFTGPKIKVARPIGAKKLARIKKVKQIIEHVPTKSVTVIIDPKKLSIGEDKQIIDAGGGMAQIPIKFKRKRK
jgi:hypothetical protein